MHLPIVYVITFLLMTASIWIIAFYCQLQFDRIVTRVKPDYPLLSAVLTKLFSLWYVLFTYTTPLWIYCALTFWLQPDVLVFEDSFYIPLAFWYVFYGLAVELPEEPSEAVGQTHIVYISRH